MAESLHKIILWIHIPFGFLSLVLFWIPVGVKKGGKLHKQVGWYYYICMWIVVVTAALLCICNIFMAKYIIAAFLGYISVVSAYPLWYSYEILKQKKIWTNTYFLIRKAFSFLLIFVGIAMIYLGAITLEFRGMGPVLVFFGVLGFLSFRDALMSFEQAMKKETKLKMHIQGTIITGIAAYTAFLAFGGRTILVDVLQIDAQWMVIPWIAPTILGVFYSRYMKRKYNAI